MKKIITILAVVLFTTILFAQEEVTLKNGKIIIVNNDYTWKYKSDNIINGSFTDPRDGKTYKTIKIGKQIWMAENLAYKSSSGYTPVQNNIKDATKYGYLYNLETAKVSCPDGWHLPTDAEWDILINFLGGANVAGGKLKEPGTTHWRSPNTGATNESGFSALPGGYHNEGAGHYEGEMDFGIWWSSTNNNLGSAWSRNMVSGDSKVGNRGDLDYSQFNSYSVRCVKDRTANSEPAKEKSFTNRVCGEWKYKDASNNDVFYKITKRENGKFNLQKGTKDYNKMIWGNMDSSVGTGVNLELLNETLVGKCRIYEGSAPDAYYDTNFNIGFRTVNTLLFKTNVHTGGGVDYNESFEATKISN